LRSLTNPRRVIPGRAKREAGIQSFTDREAGLDSGFAAARRPGMTKIFTGAEKIFASLKIFTAA
jgi:hypothetical protein